MSYRQYRSAKLYQYRSDHLKNLKINLDPSDPVKDRQTTSYSFSTPLKKNKNALKTKTDSKFQQQSNLIPFKVPNLQSLRRATFVKRSTETRFVY